ncbi:MAG: DNA adenine methylase [Burkholderiales bacterium]
MGTPLIKWPGGKRALLKHLIPLVPKNYRNYYEPFLGGGALFFALQPRQAVLSDTNFDLINCYEQVRNNASRLVVALGKYHNSPEFYYQIRDTLPSTKLQKAARLLYLARLSFNGIHRVNLQGKFNVPYGRKLHLAAAEPEQIRLASEALARAKLSVADFERATLNAKKRDLVYFDPPYTVAHSNNGFLKYNERIFSWDDQIRLAAHAKRLAAKGCIVIVSNADHPSIKRLYPEFRYQVIERFSVIAASSDHRKRITEAIFFSNGA